MPKRKRSQQPKKPESHPLNDTLDSDVEDREPDSDDEQRPGLRRKKADISESDNDSDSEADVAPDKDLADEDGSENDEERDEDSEDEEEDDEIPVTVTGPTVQEILAKAKAKKAMENDGEEKDDSEEAVKGASKAAKAKAKGPLNPAALAKFHKVHDKTGVVYLSRIPPFMKPQKLRHLLTQHGGIGRIYLQLEPTHVAKRRIQSGGNRKDNFTEGWVEFLDKSQAKETAAMLNNTNIGGKKRNFFHDDIWNIKYLPGFKWSHLAERIAYEKATRDQKIRVETQQARRENRAYLKSVETAKMIEAIEDKKKKKAAAGLVSDAASSTKAVTEASAASAVGGDGSLSLEKLAAQFKRRFKQRKVIDEAVGGGIGGVKKGQEMAPQEREKQKRVLSKIFG
jgi:ESF2/ABP1 family protein